eukprot:1144908-Pelagomonas_calceolata.AAC.2
MDAIKISRFLMCGLGTDLVQGSFALACSDVRQAACFKEQGPGSSLMQVDNFQGSKGVVFELRHHHHHQHRDSGAAYPPPCHALCEKCVSGHSRSEPWHCAGRGTASGVARHLDCPEIRGIKMDCCWERKCCSAAAAAAAQVMLHDGTGVLAAADSPGCEVHCREAGGHASLGCNKGVAGCQV